jgi:serine/threonine protein kinase
MQGTPFGRYRLIELLGRGGMGEVWRALDTEIGRVVALKVLPADFANDATFQQRFRREARAAAGLDEPHVVPIFEVGEIDGRLYVTMRLIDGSDVHTLLRGGPLAPARAVSIIEQIASALHAAHRVGLVHRDVKPSNILLAENDFAYLIDFGIARAAGETGLTLPGYVMGTLAYLAPERLAQGQTDPRVDIYALTCVLHECLTGSEPFPGDLEQQITAHMSQPPPRPSALRAGVPAGLDAVVAKGMAKNPDERFATTRDMAKAARAALAAPPSRSPDTPPTQRAIPSADLPRPLGPQPFLASAIRASTPAGPAPRQQSLPPDIPEAAAPRAGTPKPKKSRALAIGLTCAAVFTVIALIAVFAIFSLTKSRHKAGPANPSSMEPHSSAPAKAAGIDTSLLGPAEVDQVMSATDMSSDGIVKKLSEGNVKISPDECRGVVTSGAPKQFNHTGFTAVREQTIKNASAVVGEDVLQYPSSEAASKVVTSLATSWEECRGKRVTTTGADGPAPVTQVVSEVTARPHELLARLSVPDYSVPNYTCQHVMGSTSVFIIDVLACGSNVSNQAQTIASRIDAKLKE